MATNYYTEQRAELLLSQMIAVSMMQLENGKTRAVAVFEMSTQKEFYWVFDLPDALAPYALWKPLTTHERDNPSRSGGLAGFAAQYLRIYSGQVVSMDTADPEHLAKMLADKNLRFSLLVRPDRKQTGHETCEIANKINGYKHNPYVVRRLYAKGQ